jgi:hypothetical protein
LVNWLSKKISPSGDAGSMSCRERDFRRPIDEIQIRLQKHQKKSRWLPGLREWRHSTLFSTTNKVLWRCWAVDMGCNSQRCKRSLHLSQRNCCGTAMLEYENAGRNAARLFIFIPVHPKNNQSSTQAQDKDFCKTFFDCQWQNNVSCHQDQLAWSN